MNYNGANRGEPFTVEYRFVEERSMSRGKFRVWLDVSGDGLLASGGSEASADNQVSPIGFRCVRP